MGVRLPDEMRNKIEAEAAEKQTSLSSVIHEKIKKGFELELMEKMIDSLEGKMAEQGKKISELDTVVRRVGDHVIEHKEHTVLTLHFLAEFIKISDGGKSNFMKVAGAADNLFREYLKTGKLTHL